MISDYAERVAINHYQYGASLRAAVHAGCKRILDRYGVEALKSLLEHPEVSVEEMPYVEEYVDWSRSQGWV